MTVSIQILDNNEKYEGIKQVKPNIIFNRFDLIFKDDFECVKVMKDSETYYIPFHIKDNKCCIVGIYMTKIDYDVVEEVFKYIKKQRNFIYFQIRHALVNKNNKFNKVSWVLNLPDTFEEFMSVSTSRTRRNKKKQLRILQENFNCEFKHYANDEITDSIREKYNEFKTQQLGTKARTIDTLEEFKTWANDIYTLELDGKIVALDLNTIVDNQDVYGYSQTYDFNYRNYSVGNTLYYYTIENLINRGFKKIYLGGGDYSYKENCHAEKFETYTGEISLGFNFSYLLERLFSINIIENNVSKLLQIKILGIKLTHKIK